MSPGTRSVAMAPHRTEEAVDAGLREQIAWSCRILAMGGHGDYTLGHVSARAAGGEHILMKPNGLGLEEVAPGDLLAALPRTRVSHRLGPGHRDWPLEEQQGLVALFEGEDAPVRLSEHGVMIPFKSISGLFGVRP